MSNFIVAKGLGGPLMVTDGWGAGVPTAGGCIIKSSIGNLKIFVRRSIPGQTVTLTFWDGVNSVMASLPATAAQVAGTDWMIIKVARSGTSLIVTLDKNEPVTVALGSLVTYAGNFTFMDGAVGFMFDPRVIPKAISKTASDYYFDDIYENQGKALLPNR